MKIPLDTFQGSGRLVAGQFRLRLENQEMDTKVWDFLMTANRSEIKKFRSIVRVLGHIGMGTDADMKMVMGRILVERENRRNDRIRRVVDEKSYQ